MQVKEILITSNFILEMLFNYTAFRYKIKIKTYKRNFDFIDLFK